MHPKALLAAAATLVERVLAFEQPADRVVFDYLRGEPSLGARHRRALADTVYTVIRGLPTWRWRASGGNGSLPKRLVTLAWQGRDDVLAAGLDADELAWRARALAADPRVAPEAPPHDLPPWLVERVEAQIGAETGAWCDAVGRSAPLDLRVNVAKASRDQARGRLAADGIEGSDTPYSPLGLRVAGRVDLQRSAAFQSGWIEVQDEGSQLLALALGARRGETVVDFCAGAGGKTLAIGAQMRGKGRLYALDASAARLAALPERLARAGLDHVVTMQIHQGDDDVRLQRLRGKVDRVVVDAPCSGLGTLRRHPDLAWRQTPETVLAFASLQRQILDAAARLVRLGGRLVYATCSPLAEENEAIAAAFDAAQAGAFSRLDLGPALAKAQVGSADALVDSGELHLWTHRHGTDGFYAAAWERNDGATNDSNAG